jgi:hypothetical protein
MLIVNPTRVDLLDISRWRRWQELDISTYIKLIKFTPVSNPVRVVIFRSLEAKTKWRYNKPSTCLCDNVDVIGMVEEDSLILLIPD